MAHTLQCTTRIATEARGAALTDLEDSLQEMGIHLDITTLTVLAIKKTSI